MTKELQISSEELNELEARLDSEIAEGISNLKHLFSLEDSFEDTRMHNSGTDISMEEYFTKLDNDAVPLCEKIQEAMFGA